GSPGAVARGLFAVAIVATAASGGCKKKAASAATEITGLGAVPESAEVVMGADVARVANSPLVAHAIDALLSRDADLVARWQKLRETCKLDIKQVKSLVLAIGPKTTAQPGSGPVLLVATGQFGESELVPCIRSL